MLATGSVGVLARGGVAVSELTGAVGVAGPTGVVWMVGTSASRRQFFRSLNRPFRYSANFK